eukprot:gene6673-3338_t
MAMVLTVAWSFGISIMVLIYSIAHLSGGHLNPAVTIAIIIFNEINPFKGLICIISHVLGALCGVAMSGGHLNPAVTIAIIIFNEINPFKGLICIISQVLGALCGVAMSGGHLNPAVTMAMTVFNEINPVKGLIYILSQVLGALCGVSMVKALWPSRNYSVVNLGANGLDPDLLIVQGFFLEFFGTALLVFVVFNVAVDKHGSKFTHRFTPMVIGFTVFLIHLVLIPMTGCGINPARSFASAVVSGTPLPPAPKAKKAAEERRRSQDSDDEAADRSCRKKQSKKTKEERKARAPRTYKRSPVSSKQDAGLFDPRRWTEEIEKAMEKASEKLERTMSRMSSLQAAPSSIGLAITHSNALDLIDEHRVTIDRPSLTPRKTGVSTETAS